MDFRWSILLEYTPLFLQGLKMTLMLTLIGVVNGVILGLMTGMIRLLDIRRGPWVYPIRLGLIFPASCYVGFFRGTPLFVQILLIHFALMPSLIHPEHGLLITGEMAVYIKQHYGAFLSGIVALSLNCGAYTSEIFRAGIQSIDKGQTEAARSLGMNYFQTMRYVVVPQAFRRMLPALGNEAISLMKDSSLVSAIGLAELAYAARTVFGVYSRPWEPYLAISFVYLILTFAFSFGVAYLEKRYGRGDSR